MPSSTFKMLLASAAVSTLAACTTTDVDKASSAADPRVGLAPGAFDAATAISGLERVHAIKPSAGFGGGDAAFSPAAERRRYEAMQRGEKVDRPPAGISFANTDLAFSGDMVIMGNFHGMNMYSFKDEANPELVLSVVCPGGQGDVSIHGDLVFMSVEQNRGRLDCGAGGVDGQVSAERFRGVRIFDISDLTNVRQVAAIQTCRGSHTNTVIPHPTDDNIIYVYNSGTSFVRSPEELDGCTPGQPEDNPDTALYSIDIIEVPLDAPQNARIIDSPRIFADRETGEVAGLWRGRGDDDEGPRSAQTNHCHDITAFPELGLAGGACSGNGILLDISDPAKPMRIAEAFDPNMAYWHSATFNADGTKLLFADEWGGGMGARCRADDPMEWGADTIYTIDDGKLTFQSYYKMPAAQTEQENCVSHNGNIIPVPGRDIMVQAWYSGGVSVMDFTDAENPFEIAYFDQGPLDAEDLYLAGYWSAYWHNGRIYGTEIVRGLDVFKLVPNEHLSASEIAAAESVLFDVANTQTQELFTWGDKAAEAQSYVDQLARSGTIDDTMAMSLGTKIKTWSAGKASSADMTMVAEKLSGMMSPTTDAADLARLEKLSALFLAQ